MHTKLTQRECMSVCARADTDPERHKKKPNEKKEIKFKTIQIKDHHHINAIDHRINHVELC